ncbi:MAG TPA: hypothetical protein VM716_05650 [Gemmatimonadales bacterium]|nr:hypothetical protein [Gemmatimonadales bacterium]
MRLIAFFLAAVVCVAPAWSQTTAGASAGYVKFSGERSEQALSGIIEFQPSGWLTLYAVPAWLRVSDTVSGRTLSSSGLGDLPLFAAAEYTSSTAWSPSAAAALSVVLPTGKASCGLGNGVTTAEFDLGIAVAPAEGRAHVSADVNRSLSGLAARSALSAPSATTLRFEAGYDVSPQWTWTASVGLDVGAAGSAPDRVLGLGVRHGIAGPLAVVLDGSHGLTSASPQWVLSLGLGTAYSGPSPVTPTSPLRRLQTTFGSGSGRPKAGC